MQHPYAGEGKQEIRLLKDYKDVGKAGDVLTATVWLNLDNYNPCAEVPYKGRTIPLGRVEWGGWEYARPTT